MTNFIHTYDAKLRPTESPFNAKAWLSGINIFEDFDYSIQTSYDYTVYPPAVRYHTFFFDNPRHATAFKLLWG